MFKVILKKNSNIFIAFRKKKIRLDERESFVHSKAEILDRSNSFSGFYQFALTVFALQANFDEGR